MKLNIGENIKRLRKERDITQEEFAEVLGVSCQSVSRWENNTCYPDIELVPTIAEFFGISTDKLMGVDDIEVKKAVERYLDDFQSAISVGNIDECIRVARAGVAAFPNNYALLNKLMYALFCAGSDDADIPNWKENMEKYDAEITLLGERIMKYCDDIEIKLEATSRLAFQHCEMGRKAIGRAIYETLPPIMQCREMAIWWALDEYEKLPHLRKYIRKGYSVLADGLWRLGGILSKDEPAKAIEVYKKYQELSDLVNDGQKDVYPSWAGANINKCISALYAKLGQNEEAFEYLRSAVEFAVLFDKRPEERKIYSLLLGERTVKRTDFDTADSRSLCRIMKDHWLTDEAFDTIRDTDKFNEILSRLDR